MKNFDKIATVLIFIGAINWGLIGLFQFDAIQYILGESWLDRALYLLIGFSAVLKLINWKKR